MNEKQIIKWLWRYGHFRNPRMQNSWNVDKSALLKLTLTDSVVVDAVASIQALDLNAEIGCQKYHGRAVQFDGIIGPATEELLSIPRCNIPDYQIENATGSGSWPVPGCDPNRKNRQSEHSIRINVNTRGMPYSLAYFQKFIARARACAAEFGLAARYIIDGDPVESEIAVEFASLAEDVSKDDPAPAVIGWNYFPKPGTCNQTIAGRISRSWVPSSVVMHSALWVHEQLGHGIGLQHTRGGIMNPSILAIDPLTWRGDPHESTVRRMFGGESIPIDDETTPDPDPPMPPIDPSDVERIVRTVIEENPERFRGQRGKPGAPGPRGQQGAPGQDGLPRVLIDGLLRYTSAASNPDAESTRWRDAIKRANAREETRRAAQELKTILQRL